MQMTPNQKLRMDKLRAINETYAGDLPWELWSQDNGDLLPTGIFGEPRPFAPGGALGDNQ